MEYKIYVDGNKRFSLAFVKNDEIVGDWSLGKGLGSLTISNIKDTYECWIDYINSLTSDDCNAVTMHRKSTFMEVEVCKQNQSDMLEE